MGTRLDDVGQYWTRSTIVRSVCAPPLSRDSNHRFRIHKLEFGLIGTRLDDVGQYWTRRGLRSVMLEEVMIA